METSTYGNPTAKDIEGFKTSVANNKGYYIGRYEARTSTARNSLDAPLTQITTRGNEFVYNYVTPIIASQLSRNMYTSSNFTSDLINSYAWDTATLFLQNCGTNSIYSKTCNYFSELASTGTNNIDYVNAQDRECNVYDMSGNIFEYSTETCINTSIENCGVIRGGSYTNLSFKTDNRSGSNIYSGNYYYTFRPILYL